MRNKFFGLISILISLMIGYLYFNKTLGYFLIPSMQIYLLIAGVFLFFAGIILFMTSSKDGIYISDLVLFVPFIFLFLMGDGKLSTNLANNRSSSLQNKVAETSEVVTPVKKEVDENIKIDTIDFDVVDESYAGLSDVITYGLDKDKILGKTIRVRGFALKNTDFIPNGMFGIGKYMISCCAADASFYGFFVSTDDLSIIEEEKWYEIEGVLEEGLDTYGQKVIVVHLVNIKEISDKNEDYYIYPCYSYGDGSCKAVTKYNIR